MECENKLIEFTTTIFFPNYSHNFFEDIDIFSFEDLNVKFMISERNHIFRQTNNHLHSWRQVFTYFHLKFNY